MPINSFRYLEVWQRSMELTRSVYTATASMAWPHRHEIGAQMRRACVSASSNVAEGFRQGAPRAYRRHVRIAAGSIAELETQAEVATDMKLWSLELGAEVCALASRCGQMLTALAKALETKVDGGARSLRRR